MVVYPSTVAEQRPHMIDSRGEGFGLRDCRVNYRNLIFPGFPRAHAGSSDSATVILRLTAPYCKRCKGCQALNSIAGLDFCDVEPEPLQYPKNNDKS